MTDQFIIENLQYVFGVDALETSRPINIEVNTPAEINSMFDSISYEKGLPVTPRDSNKILKFTEILNFYEGSCVIRMCADFIGFDVFQRGLTRYLNDK